MFKETDLVYIKENLILEPLVDNWYAWPHLISPATYPMNMVNRHFAIMDSYIASPEDHKEAVNNPFMLGGPFMDYEDDEAIRISELKEKTIARRKTQLDFVTAISELNELLAKKATGGTLENLYKEVPEILKGYVELTYDINHRASFRFIEGLLYESDLYAEDAQHINLYLIDNDNRSFILSTPRLDRTESLMLPIPFKSDFIDTLFKMQRVPMEYSVIMEKLAAVAPEKQELFSRFLTLDKPRTCEKYQGDEIRIRYFGHACVLIEFNGISILTDPVISYDYHTDVHRYTVLDLPDTIDYILISHNHQDHILLETMLQLRHKVKTIIVPSNGSAQLQDPSLKWMFQKIGFKNVHEMSELEVIQNEDLKIRAIPFFGEHGDLDIRTKLSYHIEISGQHPKRSILFLTDSCNLETKLFDHIHRLTGDVDVVFLGMECDGAPMSWLYGPLLPNSIQRQLDFSRRLCGSNYRQGIEIVNKFDPKHLYVYAMGQEPWLNYIMSVKYTEESNPIIQSNQMIEACVSKNRIAERLFGEKEIVLTAEISKEPASISFNF